MIIVVYSVIHLLLLFFFSYKQYDIIHHTEKYSAIPGYDKYRSSKWFWNKDSYSISDLPARNPFNWALLLGIGLAIIIHVDLQHWVQRLEYSAPDVIFIYEVDSWLFALSVLYCVGLLAYFLAFFEAPMAIQTCLVTLHNYGSKSKKSYPWKKMTTYIIIATLISWPVCIMSSYNIGYVTEEKIVYQTWYQDQVIKYDDIKKIEIYRAEHNDSQNEVWTGYIYDNLGHRFSIEDIKDDKGRIEIVEYIIKHVSSDTDISFY